MNRTKVLLFDQMGVLASERKKYEELARYDDLKITVVTPRQWQFNFRMFDFEQENGNPNYDAIPVPVISPGYGHRSFFLSTLRSILVTVRPDVIHIFQEPYCFFSAQIIFCRNLFMSSAHIIFISWENMYFENYPFSLSKVYGWIEKYAYKHSTCATAITHSAKKVLIAKGYDKPIHVMNWGIDHDLFKKTDPTAIRKALNIEDMFVVGFVGRFVEEKGIADLVKAAGLLNQELIGKDLALLLVGDGPLEPQLHTLADRFELSDKMRIVNCQSNTNMTPFFNCMDVLVLPSRRSNVWMEQLGKVLLEAMACEIPVIGSDSGEIPYVIGNSGRIFRAGDWNDLRNKLRQIIDDEAATRALVRKAKRRVSSTYSWDHISRSLHELYCSIIQNTKRVSV